MKSAYGVSSSTVVCVRLLGPLEVARRGSEGGWQVVKKEEWSLGTPPRSVLKRLLTTPGRRLSRSDLEDDLWPDAAMELAAQHLANGLMVVRRVIGKNLVETSGPLCTIADQSRIWTDLDACRALLTSAENQGCTTPAALPLLEEACSYFERGPCLEDEAEKWCHAVHADAERLQRQCRLWLAQGYERAGKLWQAGEQYCAMTRVLLPDEEALQNWMQMLVQHGKRRDALQCYQDTKARWEAQGFAISLTFAKAMDSSMIQLEQALLHPATQSRSSSLFIPAQFSLDSITLTDTDILERLAHTLSRSSIGREAEATYFDQQARLYWRAREETALPITALYTSVMRCIDDLTWLLAHAHTLTFRQHLCEIMGRTVLLGGVLLYDMGQYTKARQQYQMASQAASEAGSSLLQAVVWGWMSFTWTYSQDYQKALRCVQYACQLAALTPDTLVQAWLEAITAEIQANLLNQEKCVQSLNSFERYIDALPSLETSYLFEFNPVLLLGYKGVCLQQFYQKNRSETYIFLCEAKEALKLALESNTPLKRKVYYISDLAGAYARQGEIEQACACIAQSLPMILQSGSGSKTIHKHLLQVHTLLRPYASTASVQALDEQLAPLLLRE